MSDKFIQIIGYRKGFDKKTGKEYTYQKHFKHIQVTSISKLFANIDSIVELIPEDERHDIHYTNANCHLPTEDKSVPLRLFAYQEMIPFDLDGIDLEQVDKYIAIITERTGIDIKKCAITMSGHGIHIVVLTKRTIETGEDLNKHQRYYKALCNELNMMFVDAGLKGNVDPVRLAESATLRLPKTWNIKDAQKPKLAELIQNTLEVQDFKLTSIVEPIEEDKEMLLTLRSVDTEAVLSGCDFLKYAKTSPKDLTEPQWYAMLGTLAFIPTIGRTLCHTYSKDHPDYSYEDTENKTLQAIGFGKPRTCDSIHGVYPSCANCPHFKKIKTPLSIRSEEFIATESTGFHSLILNAEGRVDKYIPCYPDLLKFLKSKYNYIVNKNTREIMIYNGTHWETFTTPEVDGFATKHFDPPATNLKRSEFRGLMSSTNLVDEDFLGKDNSGYINFSNGILRIHDRVLLEHSPEFGFTYVLPYPYSATAKCPNFDKMLSNVTLNDRDVQTLLLEFMGYAISGVRANFGSKALILTGTGSNGKSTFLDVLKTLIGKSCYSTVSLEDMSNSNARYSMVGKLFNICEEVNEDELRKGTAIFKSITAGAELTVKRLYSDITTMRIDTKLILACNELPQSKENTYAIYRRMLIVPFRATFTKENGMDKNILGRILGEMSGVYNRILDAYDGFMKRDGQFTDSEIVTKAVDEYMYTNSIYSQFTGECIEAGTDNDVLTNDELINMYNQWAVRNNIGFKPTTIRLIKELKSMGLIKSESVSVRSAGQVRRGYKGLKRVDGGNF